jgi:hypothetical protein
MAQYFFQMFFVSDNLFALLRGRKLIEPGMRQGVASDFNAA